MPASKIQCTPGALTPSAPGLFSIQFDSSGNAYIVDDAGVASAMNGVTIHNLLSGRSDADVHPLAAISGLSTALAGKEPGLGNPTQDGMHLTSTAAGIRSWENPPEPPNLFSAKNETWQSFAAQSEVITEWDVEIIKHSKFVHSTGTNPEEITINHTGFIKLFVKSNFEINENNRILHRVHASLDWGWFPETIAYAYMRHQSYIDVGSAIIPGVILPVTSGQILRIHSQIAYNDDVSGLGVQKNVNTLWGESTITIETVVEP